MKKVLFTSYKCDGTNPIIESILNEWRELNPTYEVLYFSDEDVRAFFKETPYHDTVSRMRNGVAIADFFRVCYIYKCGGYWFDLDLQPTKIDIPEHGDVHLFDVGYKNISYMLMGANVDELLFKEATENTNQNILNANSFRSSNRLSAEEHMQIHGPRVIQNIICPKLNLENKDGCLPGPPSPTVYLEGTDYEFLYSKLHIKNKKTQKYKELQKGHGQKHYEAYNYM